MKVAILSIYSFPYGMAATNRIAAYAQGLVENGVEVDVMTIHPTDSPVQDKGEEKPDEGVYNGVRYYHPSGRYRNKSKILRALAFKTGFRYWRGAYKVRKLLRKNRYDVVVMSFDEPYQLETFSKISRGSGAKTVFIFDEYPIPIRHKLEPDIPQWKKNRYREVLRNVDGYISISMELANYFNGFATHPTYLMPVIVNEKRFQLKHIEKKDWISYIGNMELSKDNVTLIVKAFLEIAHKYPSFTLHLFGPKRAETLESIDAILDGSEFKERVLIEGLVKSEEVPAIIEQSKLMVSSQPDTLRAKGGFPTKLGEYVIMGVPTLLCDVGENRKYITEEDCYYVEPDNVKAYAQELDNILTNYGQAKNIAENGRNKILGKYAQSVVGADLKLFFENLINRK